MFSVKLMLLGVTCLQRKPKCVLWLDSARLQGRREQLNSPRMGQETQSGASRAGEGRKVFIHPSLSTHGSSVCAGSNVCGGVNTTLPPVCPGSLPPSGCQCLPGPSGLSETPMPGSTHFNGVSVEQLISGGTGNPSTEALPNLFRENSLEFLKYRSPGPSLDWKLNRSLGGAELRGQVGGSRGWEGARVGGARGGRGEVGGARWEEPGWEGRGGRATFWPRRALFASIPCFLPFSL